MQFYQVFTVHFVVEAFVITNVTFFYEIKVKFRMTQDYC